MANDLVMANDLNDLAGAQGGPQPAEGREPVIVDLRHMTIMPPSRPGHRQRAEDHEARRVARLERRLGRKTERAFKRLRRRQVREQTRNAAARVVWPMRERGWR